jgi:hypothetical protein
MINAAQNTYLIAPVAPPKRRVLIQHGGAGRGARENMPAYQEFNEASVAVELVPVYIDPAPSRAEALRAIAEARGLVAGAVENKIETVVAAVSSASTDPVTLHLDRASGHAAVIRATDGVDRTILGYILTRLPRGELWGLGYVLEAGNRIDRESASILFQELASVSERNTSADIFGEGGDPAHRILEPLIRRWIRDHSKKNLGKLVASLEPVSSAFEVTTDGKETLPLLVSIQQQWSDPADLAEQVVAEPDSPIRKGIRFVVAEVVPGEGIRFHRVRRRTDDRVSVDGAVVADGHDSIGIGSAEELSNRAARALARAERETVSRRNPVSTTD